MQCSLFGSQQQWKGPTEDRVTMVSTIMCLHVFIVLLWSPCYAVRFPANYYMQTNFSANYTDKIPFDTNRNAFLHHGYGTNLEYNLPLNYWKKSNFQTSPNYVGQIAQEKSLLDHGTTLPDGHLLNYDKVHTIPSSSLVGQTGPHEDSPLRSRYTPHNIHANFAYTHSHVKLHDNNRQNTNTKENYRITENMKDHSPFGYGQPGSEYKFTSVKDNPIVKQPPKDVSDLNYKQIYEEEMSHNSRQTAMDVEERSENGEVRRLSVLDHKKMSSEEQELMLLDVLQQKTNSSSRGFEAGLVEMLGKSESICITD